MGAHDRTVGWGVRGLFAAAALSTTGCTLVQPGCHNRDVKAAIEQEARASIEFWMQTTRVGALPKTDEVTLVEPLETARNESTRACAAKISVGSGDTAVAVPIEYEVIAGGDGRASYRWDNNGFDKAYLGAAAMSGFVKAMRPPSMSDTPAPDSATSNDSGQPADQTAPTPPAPMDMHDWAKAIRQAIMDRAGKLADMPEGRQPMRFRLGPDGDISMAAAVEPIAQPELAKRLVTFLDGTDHLPKPPDAQQHWISVTFHF